MTRQMAQPANTQYKVTMYLLLIIGSAAFIIHIAYEFLGIGNWLWTTMMISFSTLMFLILIIQSLYVAYTVEKADISEMERWEYMVLDKKNYAVLEEIEEK